MVQCGKPSPHIYVLVALRTDVTNTAMEQKRILVIVDPEQAQHACLDRAAEMARRLDAAIDLYTCDWQERLPTRWLGAMTLLQYQALVREERQRWLEQLASPLRSQGLYVDTHPDWHPDVEQAVLNRIVATKPAGVIDDELYGIRERAIQSRAQGTSAVGT